MSEKLKCEKELEQLVNKTKTLYLSVDVCRYANIYQSCSEALINDNVDLKYMADKYYACLKK
jgi:hypothetical protein